MDSGGLTTRVRVVVLDGADRHEIALAPHVVVATAVSGLGIVLVPGRRILVGPRGREITAGARADELEDGAVLSLIDLSEEPAAPGARGDRAHRAPASVDGGAWWMLAATGILLAVVAFLVPTAVSPWLRLVLTLAAAAGAVASATVWAVRERSERPRAMSAASAPLLLAFAAGAVAVPPLPGGAALLAVFAGLCAAAVVSALLAVVARAGTVRAGLGTVTLVLLGLAVVWGLALALGLDVSAPAAVSLGAVPVALRALPSTLLDVPPGMFIEYRRFQTARWAVREQLPADGGPIGAAAARDLVGRSSARLFAGTALLSVVAAVVAPFAIPSFDTNDPLVLAGRIALASCVILALLLGARKSSSPMLHWMPRAAALVVAATVLVAAMRLAGPFSLTILAGVALGAGVAIAFAVVPVGRGSRSLFWSRFGDVFEWIAVVLALPAGLLAADAIDLLRGMMAA